MRVVASLTSIPDRINLCYPTIESLLSQDYPLSAIYLTIAKTCRRGTEYPKIDDKIMSNVTLVTIKEDHGPVTKIMGALLEESDPDTLIITVDDDVIYPPTMVSNFLYHHQEYPNAALGSSGWIIGRFPFYISGNYNHHKRSWFNLKYGTSVDFLCGYAGVLYQRRFFPPRDKLDKKLLCYARNSESLWRHDDLLLSGFLSHRGVERILIKQDEVEMIHLPLGLSHEQIRFARTFVESIGESPFIDYQQISVTQSTTWPLIVILIIIIILFLILKYCF